VRRLSPYQWLAIIFLVAILPKFGFGSQSEWQSVYVYSSRLLRDGEGLYQQHNPYVYPPFMATAAIPLTYLPEQGSRLAWFAINAWALAFCCRAAWRLSGGGMRLPGWDDSRRDHLIFGLGLGCAGYYLIDALSHQQPDLVIAALVMRGCLALADGRSLLAGCLLGLAAACKCTPLLFLPLLIWRGRWISTLALVMTAVSANLIADLFTRPPGGGFWLVEWWNAYIAPILAGAEAPGIWASDVLYNQSLVGALNRWTQTEWSLGPAGVAIAAASRPLPVGELRLLARCAQLGLALAALVVFWNYPFRSWRGEQAEGAGPLAVECGLICVLMLLLSPMSSKPHFAILLLPGLCAARSALERKSRLFWSLLGLAILCGLFANKDLVKSRLYTLALWYGLVTVSTALLGILSGWMLWSMCARQATAFSEAGALNQVPARQAAGPIFISPENTPM